MGERKTFQALVDYIKNLEKVTVAFSGGVDSVLLLKAAVDALGENAMAVTAISPFIPRWEQKQAREIAEMLKARHVFLDLDLLEMPKIAKNAADRCYHCKHAVFLYIWKVARAHGLPLVIDGTNADDLKEGRPGLKAMKELSIVSPLKECGFTKEDVRRISKELGLPTHNKPAFTCLATRIPFGRKLVLEDLRAVEKAEEVLMGFGFNQMRVRNHGDVARLEIPVDNFPKLMTADLNALTAAIKDCGFVYVSLDLEGMRSGSMNEALG